MKKFTSRLLALLMLMAMAISLVGCAAGDTAIDGETNNNTTPADDENSNADVTGDDDASGDGYDLSTLKIAFLMTSADDASLLAELEAFEKATADWGCEITVFDAQANAATQDDQIHTAIAQGIDVITGNVVDPTSCVTALRDAKDAGVKICLVGNLPDDTSVFDSYVGIDDIMMGKNAAQAIMDALPDGGNVVEIEGAAGSFASESRKEGFAEAIEGTNITLLETNVSGRWSAPDAMALMEDYITKYGDSIDAVFCHWDNGLISVVEACQNAGLDVVAVSCDGCKNGFDLVTSGKSTATIMQNFDDIMTMDAECIKYIVNGGTYSDEEKIMMSDPVIVTIENAGDYEVNW